MWVLTGIAVFFLVVMVASVAVTVWKVSHAPKENLLVTIDVANSLKDEGLRHLLVRKVVGMSDADDDNDDNTYEL